MKKYFAVARSKQDYPFRNFEITPFTDTEKVRIEWFFDRTTLERLKKRYLGDFFDNPEDAINWLERNSQEMIYEGQNGLLECAIARKKLREGVAV